MTRSALRSAWFLGSLLLVACGGRTLGLETEEDEVAGSAGASSGKGGSSGGGGSVSSGAGGVSAGGRAGTGAAAGSVGVSGSGGTGGATGKGGSGGTGGATGKGGSGGTGGATGKGGSSGKGGKGGSNQGKGGSNQGKGGTGGTGGFQSCDACQQVAFEKCQPEYEACLDDKSCGQLLSCFQDCGDDDLCANNCFEQYPDAQQPYYELVGCVICGDCEIACDAPADFCAGFNDGPSTPPSPGGQPGQP